MKKVWINGADGQIGHTICKLADKLKYEIFDTDQDEIDITDIEEVIHYAEMIRPDIILNCAGLTDVAYCEEHLEEAYKVNAIGARNLAIAARQMDAAMVQISTDDVFDGASNEPYNEFDKVNPCTNYGKSKFAGEQYVREFTHRHFIVRSNWVYGNGTNFVTNLIEKATKENEIGIHANYYGSPTSVNELARFVLCLMDTHEYGTYHVTCQGTVSRHEFAKEVLKLAGVKCKIIPLSSFDEPEEQVRPAYAVLDNMIMRIAFDYEMMNWKEALKEYMEERLENEKR